MWYQIDNLVFDPSNINTDMNEYHDLIIIFIIPFFLIVDLVLVYPHFYTN